MAQIFHPSFNTFSRVSIFGAVFFVGAGLWAWDRALRSPWTTQEDVARSQPLPFSHEHHVRGLGIDCRFCHAWADESASAGIPPTKTCMGCHSMIWPEAGVLEPVRESWRTDEPIPWKRVHDLPDFAYFDHSIHVAKGVGCTTCHGQVDRMPLVRRAASLDMGWCLDCHRDPAANVRPRERVYDVDWDPESLTSAERQELARRYHLESAMNCSDCHR